MVEDPRQRDMSPQYLVSEPAVNVLTIITQLGVPDDKMLMVWDLYPPSDESIETDNLSPPPRPQPTAYAIPFPHPLTSINSHPTSSKEFLVSDCRGSLFLTDWRSDPDDPEQGPWHHLVELVEPYALAEASRERATQCCGSVAWQRESADV